MKKFEVLLPLCIVAFLAAALLAPADAQAQTTDFRALPLPGLADGAEGYTAATTVTDPITGITLTGYASAVRGSGYAPAALFRRNVPNDHGIGVCSEGQTACETSGGDVNEVDNNGLWEIIALTRPAGKEWVSVQVSSMDANDGGPQAEEGRLYAATDPTNMATWTLILEIVGNAVNVEPSFLIPDPHKEANYLVFEPVNEADASNFRNNDFLVWQATVFEPVSCDGVGTPGYWMNHPEAWPVAMIEIGGVDYTVAEAIAIMKAPGRGDKTYDMFAALVAAKLNSFIGCGCGSLAGDVTAADNWLMTYPLGSNVRANSEAWKLGELVFSDLDFYNNGFGCARARQ